MPHKWTPEDDIIAFYLYRYESSLLKMTTQFISKKLGMSEASLRMRIGNFKAIDGKGGLQNCAKLSEMIFNQYKDVSQEIHLDMVKEILQNKVN